MPLYPLSIIFSQRNALNTKFDEKYLSGSNILFGTDASGSLIARNVNEISSPGAATTGSNVFSGSQIISGSLVVVPNSLGDGGNITASNAYFSNSISSPSGSFVSFQLNTTASAPTSPTDSGLVGEVRLDDDYIYVYVNNKWKRIAVGIWY